MKKSKSKKYMSEENFNLLVESLNQAIEYERGERNELRVTVLPAPLQAGAESAETETSIRELVVNEVESLSEAELRQVADYVAFLRFQGRRKITPALEEPKIAALYAEFADEDRELAEAGMVDYAVDDLSLEEMVALITEDNKHGEIDFGPPVGKEVW